MNTPELTTRITKQLSELLPADFTLNSVRREAASTRPRADIEAEVQTPMRRSRFVIEVKNADRIAPLREAAHQAKRYATERNAVPFVAGVFFGDRAKAVLKEEGVGFLDLAGNFYVKQPDFYAEKVVDKNPFSKKPPLKNLFAPTSSRITRALLVEPTRQWQARELAAETDVSLGQTYIVIDGLIEEELITKTAEGTIELKSPTALLDAWKKVYPTYQARRYRMYSFARDKELPKLIVQASKEANLPYALGFFSGADLVAPFIRGLSKIQLYTSEEAIETWKTKLDLKGVDSGGNVELYVPYDKGVFYKQQEYRRNDGAVNIVSNVQLYMDLFNDPARGEEAADHLRKTKLGY